MNYDELLTSVTEFVNRAQQGGADAADKVADVLENLAATFRDLSGQIRPKAGAEAGATGEQDAQKLQQCLDKLNEVQGVQAQAGQRAPVGAVPWLTVAQVIATLIRTILDATKKQ